MNDHVKWIKQNAHYNHKFSEEEEAWIKKQIQFRYGKAYQLVIIGKWHKLRPQIQTQKINRWLSSDDTTYEKINAAYGAWGKYRHQEALAQIQIHNILSQNILSKNKKMKKLLPLIMVDTMGPFNTDFWTYNRRKGTTEHILWPLCSHYGEFMRGMNDNFSWKTKKHKLVFRGVTTGPLLITKFGNTIKSSRYEIISKWVNKSWADLGFTRIIDVTKKHPKWKEYAPKIQNLIKPKLLIKQMLANKFILCIEGNDVSTSFGWALASNSIPIHPYPFTYEVWYFQGLKPWVHFIPCNPDGSDIELIMKWAYYNDEICYRIAQTGREYMKKMLNPKLYIEILKRMYNMWQLLY